MTIEIEPMTITAEGFEGVMAAIQAVYDEIAGHSKISGCALRGIERTPYPGPAEGDNDNNAQILAKHATAVKKRDVVTLTSGELDTMCTAFVDETIKLMQEIIDKEASNARKDSKRESRGLAAIARKNLRNTRKANSVLAKSFQAMMRRWMQYCSDKITSQTSTDGSAFPPLGDRYARKKFKHVGFFYPALVRSGQLRDNLNPAELAKNVIIKRGGTINTSTGTIDPTD